MVARFLTLACIRTLCPSSPKRMPWLRSTLRSRTCSWMFGLDMSPLIATFNELNYSLLYDIHKRRERWKRFSSVCSPRFIAIWSAGALTCMKNICSFSGIDVALIQGFIEALSVDAILVGLYDAPDHLLVKQRDIWQHSFRVARILDDIPSPLLELCHNF